MELLMQERKIDIVLTDYCMPEMDGYELLKAIKVRITDYKSFHSHSNL